MSSATQIVSVRPAEPDLPARVLAEIESLPTEAVEQRFAEATLRTAQGLTEMAACVRVLESRGHDLSKLKLAILPYLRLIANGQLLPELVLKFAANPALLGAVARLPLPDQANLAKDGSVEIAVIEADHKIGTRTVDPRALTRQEINRVFGADGIVPPHAQIVHRNRRPGRKPRRIYADASTRMLHVAQSKVPLTDVMRAIADAAGKDGEVRSEADGPSAGTRLSQKEYDRMNAACKAMRVDSQEFIRRAILSWLI